MIINIILAIFTSYKYQLKLAILVFIVYMPKKLSRATISKLPTIEEEDESRELYLKK